MKKTKNMAFLALLSMCAGLLFSCGAHFDIVPYYGLYSLASYERAVGAPESDIELEFPIESKLRITLVEEHPQTVYSDRFFAYTAASATSEGKTTSWYCWFFEDCSLEDYSLRDEHLETNKYVFWLNQDLVSNQSNIDPISFSFSWINKSAGTIRIVVEFQSYTAIFEG